LGTWAKLATARFDFTRPTTNIAAAATSCAALSTGTERNTRDGFFASAATCKARGGSLAMALGTQCFFWHLLTSRKAVSSVDGRVDEQN
jgi:hypothetical protein